MTFTRKNLRSHQLRASGSGLCFQLDRTPSNPSSPQNTGAGAGALCPDPPPPLTAPPSPRVDPEPPAPLYLPILRVCGAQGWVPAVTLASYSHISGPERFWEGVLPRAHRASRDPTRPPKPRPRGCPTCPTRSSVQKAEGAASVEGASSFPQILVLRGAGAREGTLRQRLTFHPDPQGRPGTAPAQVALLWGGASVGVSGESLCPAAGTQERRSPPTCPHPRTEGGGEATPKGKAELPTSGRAGASPTACAGLAVTPAERGTRAPGLAGRGGAGTEGVLLRRGSARARARFWGVCARSCMVCAGV